jgi:hypothetical protein
MRTSVRRALESAIDRDGRGPSIDVGVCREVTAVPRQGPPSDLVAVLSRWHTQGGHWRVVNETEAWLTVELMNCDDEGMSRVTAPRTAVLTAFLGGRTASSE